MRIALDARLLHYRKAGIGQYILRLLEGLDALAPEEEMVILRSRKQRDTDLPRTRFGSVPLWTPPHNRFEQFGLRVELSRLHLDLLHSPDFIPLFYRHFQSVITVHDLAFLLYPHLLTRESAHYYGQIDQAVRSADHIIAVSETTKKDVIRLLGAPEEKVTVIPEAVNPIYRQLEEGDGVAEVRQRYHLPEQYAIFVGTIEPRKNLPTLMRAIRRLKDQHHTELVLAVAGQWGWLYDDVLHLHEELKLQDLVRFLGRVSDEDLVALYNGASVLAYPSHYEGFGLPPLEAMACGTPVIVSNTSALPEVVGDAGLLVTPEDDEGLTVALLRVLSDPELRDALIRRGLQRASGFTVTAMAEKSLALYRSVLAT
ncbi:MAG: glycosyltransferase family 4 protein [Anaerolineae bacterium]|nr:glycosyltransferase family 4 protein [Anaerolineae bacterium]